MKWNILLVCTIILVFNACAPNKPYRVIGPIDCKTDIDKCKKSYLEKHENYDLAFVEFSERGNLFSNERASKVLEKIKEQAASKKGVALITFIHGWKHNAHNDDANVKDFKKVLKEISEIEITLPNGTKQRILNERKLMGLYIGWRGLSVHGLGLENGTFWDRKAVAEKMGKGVSDILLNVNSLINQKKENLSLTIGHSFGGAITLSAMNKIVLTKLIEAKYSGNKPSNFGDGIILLNPAIEANEILQLKEESMRVGNKITDNTSRPLMYIVSSKGDTATHCIFPPGQFLGTALNWNEEDLTRQYNNTEYILDEYDLDLETIGNYKPFRTGEILDKENQKEILKEKKLTFNENELGDWKYQSKCNENSSEYLPCTENEPLQFLYTSKSFIGDHGDIFNRNVKSYLASIISNSLYNQTSGANVFEKCSNKDKSFNFWGCFDYHYSNFE